MAVTQADIDSLTSALAAGVRSATIGGQTVTYNTTASLIVARDRLQKDFNEQTLRASGKRRIKSYRAVYTGRGFC